MTLITTIKQLYVKKMNDASMTWPKNLTDDGIITDIVVDSKDYIEFKFNIIKHRMLSRMDGRIINIGIKNDNFITMFKNEKIPDDFLKLCH
jgi:hypothetical protein